MKVKLVSGSELEVGDLKAINTAIDEFETQLAILRRLEKATAELQGVKSRGKKEEKKEANGTEEAGK